MTPPLYRFKVVEVLAGVKQLKYRRVKMPFQGTSDQLYEKQDGHLDNHPGQSLARGDSSESHSLVLLFF
jgi:hypothetical protein